MYCTYVALPINAEDVTCPHTGLRHAPLAKLLKTGGLAAARPIRTFETPCLPTKRFSILFKALNLRQEARCWFRSLENSDQTTLEWSPAFVVRARET